MAAKDKFSIFNSDSDYQEFSELFEKKIDEHNSRVITPSTTNNNTDKLVEAYDEIVTNLDSLVENYSSTMKTQQQRIADTFVQVLNLSIYQLILNKDYEAFDNLLKYLKDMMGDDSPIMLLLKELERLIMLYVNITKETCSKASDKAKFDTLDTLNAQYSAQKYKVDNIRSAINDVITDLSEAICSYNQLVDEYNDSDTVLTKLDNMYIFSISDIDRYSKAYYIINNPVSSDLGKDRTYDSSKKYYIPGENKEYYKYIAIEKQADFIKNTRYDIISPLALVYNNAGTITTRAVTSTDKLYSYRKSNYTKQTDYLKDMVDFYNTNKSKVNFPTTYYRILGITEHDSTIATEVYSSDETYYTYDVMSDTYTLAVFEGDDPSFDGETTYYTITWSDPITLPNTNCTWTQFTALYDDSYSFYVKYTGEYGTIYMENGDGWKFLKNYLLLNGANTSFTNTTAKYREEQARLGYIKTQIAEIHIEEKDNLKVQIHNIIDELLRLLLLDATKFSLLPDGFSLDEPDSDGHCDISAEVTDSTGNVVKSAKSFFVKKFKGNRFYAYMGEVNKKGFVGQKAQVYGYIPVKQNSTERLSKTVTISSPLLDVNALQFKNNPKNVVFGLFNIYDYTATVEVENDGEGKNKKNKNPYVTDTAALRFGSILSSKDIDLNDTKQSFRLRVDSNSGWSNGKIYKKGLFEIYNVSITAKFDDELVGEYIKYSYPEYFSDSVSITMKIQDVNTGVKYTFKSSEDLTINKEYTAQENEKGQHTVSTYYKGTMTIEEDTEANTESNSATVNYSETKDVVLRLTPISSNQSYEIGLYLDPDSSSNANYYEDSGNDPAVYLPMIASNFTIPVANVSSAIRIDLSNKLDSLSALLDLCNMLEDDFDPFDELMYSNLIDRFKDAKDGLVGELLAILQEMANIVTGITTVNGIYSGFDPLYCDTYTKDLLTSYANVQASLQTYTSSSSADLTALYDGSFSESLGSSLKAITNTISDTVCDVMESENLLHNFDNKLCTIMRYNKNSVNFASTLAIFYDVVTGASQTISTMNSAGQPVVTFPINYAYPDWINVYDALPCDDQGRSRDYFIETSTLQYIYIITQALNIIKDTSVNMKYNPSYEYVKEFLKSLLLRQLKENISNPYYSSDLFLQEVSDIMAKYVIAEKNIDCTFLSFNKYYLNPYITELFPQLKSFNTYNLDDFVIRDFNDGTVEKCGKALIYKAILETSPSEINTKLTNLYNFLTNGQKLNVREVIFMYSFISVLKEMKDAIATRLDSDGNPTINKCYSITFNDFNMTDYIKAILEYRTLINQESDYPIRELMRTTTEEVIPDDYTQEYTNVPQLFNNVKTISQTDSTNIYTGTSDEDE